MTRVSFSGELQPCNTASRASKGVKVTGIYEPSLLERKLEPKWLRKMTTENTIVIQTEN